MCYGYQNYHHHYDRRRRGLGAVDDGLEARHRAHAVAHVQVRDEARSKQDVQGAIPQGPPRPADLERAQAAGLLQALNHSPGPQKKRPLGPKSRGGEAYHSPPEDARIWDSRVAASDWSELVDWLATAATGD